MQLALAVWWPLMLTGIARFLAQLGSHPAVCSESSGHKTLQCSLQLLGLLQVAYQTQINWCG
jgi:hypothetical protein